MAIKPRLTHLLNSLPNRFIPVSSYFYCRSQVRVEKLEIKSATALWNSHRYSLTFILCLTVTKDKLTLDEFLIYLNDVLDFFINKNSKAGLI